MDLQLYGGKSRKTRKNNKKSNHKKKIHIPAHNRTHPGMDLHAKQINEILGDDVGKNNIILNKQIFNRSMNNLKAYNQDTTLQPKQQTLDPRIMNNLFTATELFVNAIVSIIHAIEELIEDEEPFINRLNWKVLFDDFSKFKVVMTTWITSNTQRNVPTIVVEIDKIISYFNQLLVIIQTYERMPTRPELSKLNKTMVNNMTNYLSSISGSVNKLVDFNIDNVNDGFIDPENDGMGGDDDFDDDSAGSEVVDRSFVGGDEDEAVHIQNLMNQFGVSQEDAQQMYEFLLQDDVQNEAQAMESRGPLNYDEANVVLLHQNGFITKDQFDEYMADVIANTSFSDRRILNNMSRFGLTREQAVEFEEERQGQNDEIERIKTDYDLDDFDAELMFMYERQIISYEEFEEKKAAHQRPRLQPITVSTKASQDDDWADMPSESMMSPIQPSTNVDLTADDNPYIQGPEFDMGGVYDDPVIDSRYNSKEIDRIIHQQLQDLRDETGTTELNPDFVALTNMSTSNFTKKQREELKNAKQEVERLLAENKNKINDGSIKEKGSQQPKNNYDRQLTAAEKKQIRTKVDNQFRKFQRPDYVVSPAYENIMNYSQNPTLSETYRNRMDMINNAFYSMKYQR